MFELLDHTADIGVKGRGNSLEEAFAGTAKGMFSVMTDLNKVKSSKKIDFEVEAENKEELLVEFLNELLFLSYTKKIFFKEFEIEIRENKLKCRAGGEKMDERKHELLDEVKAATYTGLKIGKEKGIFFAQCILDV